MKFTTILILIIQLLLSSCFRLVPRSDTIEFEKKISFYKQVNSNKELCSLALNPIYLKEKDSSTINSALVSKYAADCYRFGYGDTELDLNKAITKYQESATCGGYDSITILRELNQDIPNIRYQPGTTFLYNSAPGTCGLTQELTVIGWILVFPPMAILALPMGIFLVVAGTAVSLIAIPIN